MASAILRSAGALRHRLPRLLSSSTRSTPRRAGLPAATGDARLFSSSSVGRSYAHPCKLNKGNKRLVGMEGQLESINVAAKEDARGWREIREQLEQSQIKHAQVDKRHDMVVLSASAALTLALLGVEYVGWLRRNEEMAEVQAAG